MQILNVTAPTITAKVDSTFFQISIGRISEVRPDANETVEKVVIISNIEFDLASQNNSAYQFWNFSTTLDFNAILKMYLKIVVIVRTLTLFSYVTYFIQPANMTFANETLYMAENTFKVVIQMDNWQFTSEKNYLLVEFDNEASGSTSSGDKCLVVNSQNDLDDSLRWFSITVDGVSMFSKMLEV